MSPHQGRRCGGRVQEGREVLVRVRVLVLMVVLMDLEVEGRDARLVLGCPAGGAGRGAGGGRTARRGAAGGTCCVSLGAGGAAAAVSLLRGHEVGIQTQQFLICREKAIVRLVASSITKPYIAVYHTVNWHSHR